MKYIAVLCTLFVFQMASPSSCNQANAEAQRAVSPKRAPSPVVSAPEKETRSYSPVRRDISPIKK